MIKKANNIGSKGNLLVWLLVGCLILGSLAVVISIYFFGMIGLFQVLGVTYTSVQSLLLFVLVVFGLGIVTEILSKALILCVNILNLTKAVHFFFTALIDSWFSWIAVHTADSLMDSITIATGTEVVLAIFLFVLDYGFEGKKDNKK
ncbi:hypothetical protein FZC66_10120 [Priestia megaterium]|nr:hypothetical protein FZC66_10120 [Priestia megaterium]